MGPHDTRAPENRPAVPANPEHRRQIHAVATQALYLCPWILRSHTPWGSGLQRLMEPQRIGALEPCVHPEELSNFVVSTNHSQAVPSDPIPLPGSRTRTVTLTSLA